MSQVLVLILLDLSVVGSDAIVLGPPTVQDVWTVAVLLMLVRWLLHINRPEERAAHVLVAVVYAPRAKVIKMWLQTF